MRRAIITTFIARVGVALGGLLWTVVLARMEGPKVVGEFFLAFSVLMGVSVICRMGSESGLIRFAGRTDSGLVRSSLLGSALRTTLLASVGFALAIFAAKGVIASLLRAPGLPLALSGMSASLIPFSITAVLRGYMKAMKEPARATLLDTGGVLAAATVLLMISRYFREEGIPLNVGWVFFFSSAFVCLLAVWWNRNEIAEALFRKGGAKDAYLAEYEGSRITYMTAEVTGFLQIVLGTLVAGIVLTVDDLGRLRAAERMAGLMVFALIIVNSVIAPHIARSFAAENLQKILETTRSASVMSTLFALPLFCLMMLAPTQTLEFFGEEFKSAAPSLRLLGLAQFLSAACGPVLLVLNMIGEQRLVRLILLGWGMATVALIPILAGSFALTGAALAFAFGMAGQNVTGLFWVHKKLGSDVSVVAGIRQHVARSYLSRQ